MRKRRIGWVALVLALVLQGCYLHELLWPSPPPKEEPPPKDCYLIIRVDGVQYRYLIPCDPVDTATVR